MLEFISAGVGALLLVVGVLALLSARVRNILKGIPVANKVFSPMTWAVIFIALGVLTGGLGVATSYVGLSTASITGSGESNALNTVGGLDLKIHDGLSNATTTEDYYNDAETVMDVFSADANIADGEEYLFNITIEREFASEDAVITITCSAPDKEISGITADSLIEKTGGEIDLDINDGGKHSDDNTVYKRVSMAEGVTTSEVQVALDQEETYHDGMEDFSSTFEVTCVVSDETGAISESVTAVYQSNG